MEVTHYINCGIFAPIHIGCDSASYNYSHLCRPFHGLIKDMTRCYNLYRSDFSAALSLQVIASLILIYFANITQAFTFGAVLSDHTNSTLVRGKGCGFRGLGCVFLQQSVGGDHRACVMLSDL